MYNKHKTAVINEFRDIIDVGTPIHFRPKPIWRMKSGKRCPGNSALIMYERFLMGLRLDHEGFESIPHFSMVCMKCANLKWDAEIKPMTCRAFPGGIPLEIWDERKSHTSPYPRDNGIMFTPKEK